MTTAKHTPGPWSVEDRRAAPIPNVRIVSPLGEVAQVRDVHMRDHHSPHEWTHAQADELDAVGLANARLISAAPDLLAVAELLLWEFPDLAELVGGSHARQAATALVTMARAATAKATGGPPP